MGARATGNQIDKEHVWSTTASYRFQSNVEAFTSGVVEVHCFADNVQQPQWSLVLGGGQYRVTISGAMQSAVGNYNLAFASGSHNGIRYDSIVVGP